MYNSKKKDETLVTSLHHKLIHSAGQLKLTNYPAEQELCKAPSIMKVYDFSSITIDYFICKIQGEDGTTMYIYKVNAFTFTLYGYMDVPPN